MALLAAASASFAGEPAVDSVTLRVTLGDFDSTFVVTRRPGGAILSFRRSDGIEKSVVLTDRDWREILVIASGPGLMNASDELCPRRSVEFTVRGLGAPRLVRACAGAGSGAGAILMRLADALGAAIWLKPAEA